MNDLSVAIIIVTYNAMPWISKCLESTKPYPVVVVDNASQDETLNYIKTNYPEITLLPQDTNLGFGQANNIGISYALKKGAESVFLLNQDAYLVNDCLENLVSVQKNNPEYGILSPIHLNGKGNLLDKNFSHYVRYDANPYFYSDFVLNIQKKLIYEVPFVNAAGWLLSKKCLETVGGFDPLFFHYGEDDNYCQRANYHGFKVGVVPTTFLKHDRENRKLQKVEKYSKQYLDKLERGYILKYADINIPDGLISLKNEKYRLKKTILKSNLKLRFATANQIKKQLAILDKIKLDIENSRNVNIRKGKHYL
ncbi:MAG: glycosyltransferase family 2 protein [Flavobacteriales bacterium]|jgi:GT2 family glycosyltransferase|nr:glycosyltransferase family 2 protein [Flavobacteriales bacterium]